MYHAKELKSYPVQTEKLWDRQFSFLNKYIARKIKREREPKFKDT